MKWEHYPNLRRRPPTPSKNRGPVQVRIRRAFLATGAEVLSSSAIYDCTHPRRRCGRSKTLPAGIYWGTLQVLRTMCEPVERVRCMVWFGVSTPSPARGGDGCNAILPLGPHG